MRQHLGDDVEADGDLAATQLLQQRRAALVGHDLELEPGRPLQHHPAK